METKFKLDRNAYCELSYEDADKTISDFKNFTWQERLIVANQLIAAAYNFPIDNPPKMDRSAFKMISRNG